MSQGRNYRFTSPDTLTPPASEPVKAFAKNHYWRKVTSQNIRRAGKTIAALFMETGMEFSFKERYNYWYYSFRFTFDKEHGFGIEYGVQGQQESRRTFFEDASLVASSSEGDETVDSIKHMYGLADNSWRRSSAAEEKFIKDVFAKGVCKFSLDKEKRIQADSLGKQTFGIRSKERNRYTHWLHAVCSCKKTTAATPKPQVFCKEPSGRPDACFCRS